MQLRLRAFLVGVILAMPQLAAAAPLRQDDLWNPFHINQLPPEIRRAVLARCPSKPDAAHYFVTYYQGEVRLHFEHFLCAQVHFCDAAGCLHEIYRPIAGHYRRVKSYRGFGDD
jgi:hypothetical protein